MTPNLRQYARTVERRWAALLERPVLLGERDWSLISDWYERKIPLALIEESIDALAEKLSRRRSSPRNLGPLARIVEESWSTVVEGRSEPDSAPSPAADDAPPDALDQWAACAAGLAPEDPLRDFVETLVARVRAGMERHEADRELSEGLLQRLPLPLREQLEAAADARTQALRQRMSGEVWGRTRKRALLSTARRKLGLPRLSPQPVSE